MSQHIKICIFFILVTIPVAMIDYYSLGGGAGSHCAEICLDFGGLLTGAYLCFLLLHILTSSIIRARKASWLNWRIHSVSALLVILLIATAIGSYSEIESILMRKQYEEKLAWRKSVLHSIELSEWSYFPNAVTASEIQIKVKVGLSGRFVAGVEGKTLSGSSDDWYFEDEFPSEQRQVRAGEIFLYRIPLKRKRYGTPELVEFDLYLFDISTEPGRNKLVKQFTTNFNGVEDDGDTFYSGLPPPNVGGLKE